MKTELLSKVIDQKIESIKEVCIFSAKENLSKKIEEAKTLLSQNGLVSN